MTERCPGGAAFEAEWKAWRERRAEQLRHPTGWLALTGLHWLAAGGNRVEGLPGVFSLVGGLVSLAAAPEAGYLLDGAPVTARALASDAAGRADRLRLGSRTVQVIERGGSHALRVWDAESPALARFAGVDAFPPDPRWRIEARWEAYPAPRAREVAAAAGPPRLALAAGKARFEGDGRALSLEAVLEEGALLFVFKDATAPLETYGAGRFLGAELPRGGAVVLDFNRAYNPPCAFTPHATCPLPPPWNVLPIRVEAGEKRYQERG